METILILLKTIVIIDVILITLLLYIETKRKDK